MSTEGWVYFIQAVGGGPIKIGHSTNPAKRIRSLQAASPNRLMIVGLLAGSRFVEKRIQHELSGHRLSGEWFEDCDAIRSYVAASPETERIRALAEALKAVTEGLTLAVDRLCRGDLDGAAELIQAKVLALQAELATMKAAA